MTCYDVANTVHQALFSGVRCGNAIPVVAVQATYCGAQGTYSVALRKCLCNAGFVGTVCDVACDPVVTCGGHGVCTSTGTVCECAAGFTGSGCGSCAAGYDNYPFCAVVPSTGCVASNGRARQETSSTYNAVVTNDASNEPWQMRSITILSDPLGPIERHRVPRQSEPHHQRPQVPTLGLPGSHPAFLLAVGCQHRCRDGDARRGRA
jgi:hypothetical protein